MSRFATAGYSDLLFIDSDRRTFTRLQAIVKSGLRSNANPKVACCISTMYDHIIGSKSGKSSVLPIAGFLLSLFVDS